MILQRIKQYIDAKGISVSAFEKSIGMSNASFGKSLKNNGTIGCDKLENILRVYTDLNPTWVITGVGNMLTETTPLPKDSLYSQPTLITAEKVINKQDEQEIPLFDITAAAGCVELFHCLHDQTPIDTIKIPNLAKCDGAVFVRGDSMYPILKSGDIILYKTLPELANIIWGETYIVSYESYGDYYTVVKYVKRSTENPDNILLISQNEHHQPYEINLSQVKGLALVRASIRYNNM